MEKLNDRFKWQPQGSDALGVILKSDLPELKDYRFRVAFGGIDNITVMKRVDSFGHYKVKDKSFTESELQDISVSKLKSMFK